MSWSVTASDESVGAVTPAAGVTVLVAALTWSSGSPTYCRWDGTDMTLAVSVALGSTAAGIWFLNKPAIVTGAITTDVTMTYANAISITGTIGETAAVVASDTNQHAGNDFILASVATAVGDIVIYAGNKVGGGNWSNVDTNYGRSAFEVAVGSPTVGTWGDVSDDEIVACAVALRIKSVARMAGIIEI